LASNARSTTPGWVTIQLVGLPERFAVFDIVIVTLLTVTK
jgi:hypothetical protein